jgi:hypothetical protein
MVESFVKYVHALVSNDSKSHQTELLQDVHALTGELWNRILPHIIWLSTQAEIQGQKHGGGTSSLNDQSIWFHVFESMAERIIQKTLNLRTRLSGKKRLSTLSPQLIEKSWTIIQTSSCTAVSNHLKEALYWPRS